MADYRGEFFDFAPVIFLDCAYHGPFPRSAVRRIEQAIELKRNPAKMEAHHFFDITRSVRARLAPLVGAAPADIALTNSATQGIAAVANGLEFQAGDEVVLAGGNFPSNLFTWLHLRRQGVEVKVARPADTCPRPDDIAPLLTRRSKVLALDWVSYTTGARIDVAAFGELAHRAGAVFVVDATQGVGAMEFDAAKVSADAVAVAAYKWLLGPYATGFAYLAPGLRDRLDLQTVNWLTVEGSADFDSLPVDEFHLPPSAEIFDVPDTANFLNLYALEASLEFIQSVGVKTVTAHCRRLLDRLAEGLRARGFQLSAAAEPAHQSTILCFQAESPEATRKLHERLRARHFAVSLRHDMIRVSPYLYNTEDEIDALLSNL
ncbi:MAG: aminotransferase [Acidobacteria bacterium]|nr:MAG: aminotransferase [Acidobacteriota bacterium]